MRATLSGYYRNLQFDQSKVAKELFDVTKQISSGQKIQYAHEDTSVFIDAVRLDNEVTTLTQVKQNAQSALQVSTNTDTTMNEITKILDTMKTKLITAANETNTQESLNAIAAELRGLEKNLIQLANTSIDGKYIFAGSEVNTKPIDSNGLYQGNGKDIKAFIGSGVAQTYNINGADLFLGAENDTQRKITMNVPLINQTELYPDVMKDENLPRATGQEEYITDLSTIRDLMGDTNTEINDDTGVGITTTKHHFYIRGTDHDGLTFKETISMRDDETVGELMMRIGEAYGNSPSNELVSVTINVNGQIEIEDKRAGSSKLDFHMVANTNSDTTLANTDGNGASLDVNDLNTNNTHIKDFIKSDYTAFVSNIGQSQDLYDPNRFQLNSDFLTQDGQKARASTLLTDVLRSDVRSITFTGTDSSTPAVVGAVTGSFDVYDGLGNPKSMQDLMNAIDTAYDANPVGSGDIIVTLRDGKIVISRVNGTSPGIDIQLEANDGTVLAPGNVVDGLPSHAGVAFDEAQFKKEGSRLEGNISQVVKSDNSYATGNTKIIDVADITQGTANSLDGTVLALSGIDVNGQVFDVQINLNSAGSTFTHSNGNTYNIYDAATPRNIVDGDEMTYQQLMDVTNMVISGNLPDLTLSTFPTAEEEYDFAIRNSNIISSTSISYDGKIRFDQFGVTSTQASFSLADANGSDFTTDASVLSFQSNNALEISDPKTDFFKQIDSIISSIEAGRIRSDGTLDDPRNVGVQNSIQALDDLSEHLYNQHSIAGVQSQTLQVTSDRTEMLIINTQILRSETLDVDFAEASLEMKQLELNYQAMLSTVSRISQLSLVNYL